MESAKIVQLIKFHTVMVILANVRPIIMAVIVKVSTHSFSLNIDEIARRRRREGKRR